MTNFQNLTSKIKKWFHLREVWITNNRKETSALFLILLTGSLLRLYNIDQYMTFLGDEGRDAIIVRRFLVDFDLMLIGPGTSIGNMYLGPLYYYMIAPSLLISNFSPVGPAVMIALLGIFTIWLVWFVTREWFGKNAAVIASLLYAIAPTVIIYSRSSWNPNIMPLFALIAFYSIWKVWTGNRFFWLIVVSISLAFSLQSHYLGLLLFPGVGLFWLITFVRNWNNKELKSFLIYSLISVLIFIFLMSPLVIFDSRHGWINFEALKTFFTDRQTTVNAKVWKSIPNILPISEEMFSRLVAGYNTVAGKWILVTVFVGMIVGVISGARKYSAKDLFFRVYKTRDNYLIQTRAFILLFVWLSVAIIGLGLYKQEIYDHYHGFYYVVPFILIGGIIQLAKDYSKILYTVFVVGLVGLIIVNIQNNPLKSPPNNQLERSEVVAQRIIDEAGEEKFNFAVIAERNYEGAYQYFLEKENAPFVIIDPLRADETITNQLYVICEMDKIKCDPTHNGKAEIAGFGWSAIEEEWDVYGTVVYKLIHSDGSPQ